MMNKLNTILLYIYRLVIITSYFNETNNNNHGDNNKKINTNIENEIKLKIKNNFSISNYVILNVSSIKRAKHEHSNQFIIKTYLNMLQNGFVLHLVLN